MNFFSRHTKLLDSKPRQSGIDIVKACAIFFVVTIHFFLRTGFYQTNIVPASMYFETWMRIALIICVPLFILATGYIQSHKMPTAGWYKKLLPIIIIYLFYSILFILFQIFYKGESFDLLKRISDISAFRADGYSWYVNMFIGLFLLLPFLNVMFLNLERKHRKALIVTLVVMACLPEFINNLYNATPFGIPGTSGILVPNWWTGIYPLAYYFIGAYIKEYQIKFRKALLLLGFVLLSGALALITIFVSKSQVFVNFIGDYGSILILFMAVLFFLLVYDIAIKNKVVAAIMQNISELTLDIYLCSFLTDAIIYDVFLVKYMKSHHDYFVWFIPIVLTVFGLPFIISNIRKLILPVR
ncbi:MAG: acyltransferase family protein [Clostridia bacterium]